MVVEGLLRGRLRHAGARWGAVVVGLALAAVLPVLAGAVSAGTEQAALRRGVQALPAGDRTVAVSFNGLPDDAELTRYDRAATAGLGRLGAGPVRRQVIFREIADQHGSTFVLGGTDALAHAVRLVDGRLPASCTPARCEVVALTEPGRRAAPALDPALGLVVVGHAARTDPLLLTGSFDPGPDVPIVIADGVHALAPLAALDLFGRSYGWVAGLDLDAVRRLGVDGWVARSAAVGDDLTRAQTGLILTAPDDVLRDQAARARVSAGRFGLLGGSTAVLLLGTAVVGGAALRRDHEAFLASLRRRGASRGMLARLVAGEVGIAVLASLLLGLALAAAGAAVIGARAGLPAGSTAGAAVLGALPAVAGTAVAAGVLLAVTLVLPAGPGGAAIAWRVVDAAALGCLAVAALLVARGGISATTATSGGSGDPLLPVLPALVLLAAGLLLARAWPALTRVAARHLPRPALGARLGVAAAAGRPLRPAATAALLTAALAAAVFAGSYRATLDRGADDQAAYAVPLAARLVTGRLLERPLDVATPQVRAQVGGSAFGVLRAAASLRVGPQQGSAVQVLGVDPAVLPRIDRWTSTVGAGDPADLARRLAAAAPSSPSAPSSPAAPSSPSAPSSPAGTVLPAGGTLRIDVSGPRITLALTAYLRAADGRERGVELALAPAGGRDGAQSLTGDLAPVAAQLRDAAGRPAPLALVSLVARQPVDEASRRQHRLGEGAVDLPQPSGVIALAGLDVDGIAVRAPWAGWVGAGLAVAPDSQTARLGYQLTQGAVTLTSRPPASAASASSSAGSSAAGSSSAGSSAALPVAADPRTAAAAGPGGLLTLTLAQAAVTVRVVATLPRFPTVLPGDDAEPARFVVADLDGVGRLLDAAEPGTGQPGELWWTGPPPSAFAQPPLDRLDVRRQAALRDALRSDPVSLGAAGLLALGAALTLLVGAAALVLLVVTERQDDAGQAYAWEADGVAPRTLRASLWWRAAAVAVPAAPAGVLAGAVLAAVTARLVAVTATATAPQPPLVAGLDLGWGLVAAAGTLAASLAVAGLVAAGSLREPLPVRGRGWLR